MLKLNVPQEGGSVVQLPQNAATGYGLKHHRIPTREQNLPVLLVVFKIYSLIDK